MFDSSDFHLSFIQLLFLVSVTVSTLSLRFFSAAFSLSCMFTSPSHPYLGWKEGFLILFLVLFFLSFCLINLISLSLHSSMQGGIRIHKTFLRIIFKLRLASMSYYHTHLKNKETALCKLRSWLLFRGLANCCHHNGVMHEEGDVSLLDDLYVLPRTYARPKWPFP